MVFIIIGAVCIIIAIVLFIFRGKAQNQVLEMKYLKTSKAGELKELHDTLTKEVGPDGIKQLVEVKGTSRLMEPLVSEITKSECIGYSFTITENYDEEYEERDNEGRIVRRTRMGTNTVASNSRYNNFLLADETGEIIIDPNGAEIDMTNSADRYEPYSSGAGFIQFGAFSLNIGIHPQRRITGYNIRESILPANKNLYIVGEMQGHNNAPIIRKPADRSKPFIISQKSEEETIKQKESSATILLVIGIILGIAGLGLSAFGITRIL